MIKSHFAPEFRNHSAFDRREGEDHRLPGYDPFGDYYDRGAVAEGLVRLNPDLAGVLELVLPSFKALSELRSIISCVIF